MLSPARSDQRAARNQCSWLFTFFRQGPQIGPRVPHRTCTGGEEQQTDKRAEWRRRPMHSDLPNPSTLREHFNPHDRTLTVNRNISGLDSAKNASIRQLLSGLPSFGSGRILARSANQDDQMPACLGDHDTAKPPLDCRCLRSSYHICCARSYARHCTERRPVRKYGGVTREIEGSGLGQVPGCLRSKGRRPDLGTAVLPPAQREGDHGDRGKRAGESDLTYRDGDRGHLSRTARRTQIGLEEHFKIGGGGGLHLQSLDHQQPVVGGDRLHQFEQRGGLETGVDLCR